MCESGKLCSNNHHIFRSRSTQKAPAGFESSPAGMREEDEIYDGREPSLYGSCVTHIEEKDRRCLVNPSKAVTPSITLFPYGL